MFKRFAVLAILFVAACTSADNNAPTPVDAGRDVVVPADAYVAPVDAYIAPIDAAQPIDANPPVDAAVPLTTVKVLTVEAVVEANIPVAFADRNGLPLTDGTTAADGTFTSSDPNAWQATIHFGGDGQPTFVTVQGLGLGDAIAVTDPTELAGTASVAAFPSNAPGGASTYAARVGADEQQLTTPGGVTVDVANVANGVFPYLLVAENANDGETGYAYAKSNAFESDGTTPVTLSEWNTASVLETATLTNPQDVGNTSIVYSEIASGVATPFSYGGTSTEEVFAVHGQFADAIQIEANIVRGVQAGTSFQAIAVQGATPTTNATTTLNMASLPSALTDLEAMSLASADAGTSGQPSFTWAPTDALAASGGLVMNARWQIAGSNASGSWTIITPGGASVTSVVAPQLPASMSADGPPSDARFDASGAGISSTAVTNYAAVLQNLGLFDLTHLLNYASASGFIPPIGVNGVTVTLNGFAPGT